ncbi:MAG: hypothetical protein A4E48_02028 [Methanosaeta sp. PtaU1.Bin060]|nr:MAG: hypothetical protein A4E48_02028 [Methanosaeta sp. PtaU1.Bin060]
MSQETRPFRNSNLFSNHYIEKQVRESPEWRETNAAEAMARDRGDIKAQGQDA